MTAKSIKGVLTGALAEAGMDRLKLSDRIGIPYSTLCKRFREPETMTVGELLEIAEALKVPVQIGGRT